MTKCLLLVGLLSLFYSGSKNTITDVIKYQNAPTITSEEEGETEEACATMYVGKNSA